MDGRRKEDKWEVYMKQLISTCCSLGAPRSSSSLILDWLLERYEDTKVGESAVRAYVAEKRETYHIPKVKPKREDEEFRILLWDNKPM